MVNLKNISIEKVKNERKTENLYEAETSKYKIIITKSNRYNRIDVSILENGDFVQGKNFDEKEEVQKYLNNFLSN